MTNLPKYCTSIFRHSLRRTNFALMLLCALTIVALPTAQSQTFTILHSFSSEVDGVFPYAGVILIGGNLYGTTSAGGRYREGTVFELSHHGSGWVLSILYNFAGGQDAALPYSGVVAGPDGLLYGATYAGGNGYGAIYSLRPPPICPATECPWGETVLYRFQGGSDGARPGNADALVFDQAGNLYGTTSGDSNPDGNDGTVFELSPSNEGWTETVLYRFTRGESPMAGVTFDTAGNLYGTTEAGGIGYGTVYELTPSGSSWTYQALYEFQNTGDGAFPYGGVVFDGSGNLYGTTENDGGTVFEMRPSNGGWTFATIYQGFPTTLGPVDTPTLDLAGNIYGTVLNDHGTNEGLVFELTPFGIHLKCAPKLAADREHRKQNEHLDAYIAVCGIRRLFSELKMRGAQVLKPLEERPWACLDFYVEDTDGYILCFSEQNADPE